MSDPILIVRRVGGVDVRATLELLCHQQRGRGRTADELRPVVQAALQDEARTLVLGAFHEGLPGFAHGKLVGVLVMTLVTSLEYAGEVGWIEELYVREDYRRNGLGERLLGQALDWAVGRGLRAVDLELEGEGQEPGAAEHLY